MLADAVILKEVLLIYFLTCLSLSNYNYDCCADAAVS